MVARGFFRSARSVAASTTAKAAGVVLLLANPFSRGADLEPGKLPPPASRSVDFDRDVRPLLDARCVQCHGPKRTENGLRLDRRDLALQGGEAGPVLVPGNSAGSLLIQAVAGARADLGRMPRKADPLTSDEIGLLRAWIDQGASWPAPTEPDKSLEHWAWKAPVRPPIPAPRSFPASGNPIDAFLLERLEREGMAASPPADRVTLIRRLYLDLIGLPPTIGDVDAFVADASPDAYARLVEHLLASPHHGERWARPWLDAARYADSDGYEKDKSRQVWFYRDWVIQALNRDMPYDQFVQRQIAGDLFPGATQDDVVATGFLRNSMLNEEGAIDPEQFRMDAMFDRMDCLGKSVLGITIQCAQCHAHKYDPVTQEDYYRLFAYLNNDHETQRIVYTPGEQMKVAELARRMRELEEELRHTTPDWEERMARWEDSLSRPPGWQLCEVHHVGENSQRYDARGDGSWMAHGYAPTKLTAVWRSTNAMTSIGAFRLELLNDPNLPCNGPGRSFMGTCALTEFRVEVADAANPTNRMEVKFARATADYSNPVRDLESNFYDKTDHKRVTGPVEFAIDGKDDTAWGIDAGPGRRNVPRKAVFAPERPVGYPAGTIVTFKLVQNHGGWNSDDHMNNNLGRFRLSMTTDPEAAADPLPAAVRDILARVPRERRSPAQTAAVFSHWRQQVPEFRKVNDEIEALWRDWPPGSTALAFARREEARSTAILKRGDWLKPGRPVAAGVPRFLNPAPEGADDSRITLARWLTDRRAPTTARVFVNRVWQQYFGIGLLETAEDFGLQSPAPSHPALLDWLAVEFMEPTVTQSGVTALPFSHPWSIKHLHRLIVHSAAYRQTSRAGQELLARDPYNRLLARAPRLRVDGEIVRDIALAVSGLMERRVGGPSVFSPAPDYLFQPPASYAPFPWKEVTGADRYRRGLYTFRRRSTPYPMLQAFDVPNGDFSCVRRLRSNTPLQALTSLNEAVFVECAQALALQALSHGGASDLDRITYAFRRALGRKPEPDECGLLMGLLERQRQRIADGWLPAAEIATGRSGTPAVPAGTSPTQLAAYTVVARALLNLDETITRE